MKIAQITVIQNARPLLTAGRIVWVQVLTESPVSQRVF